MTALDVLRLLSEFALVVLIPLLIWNARLMVDFRDSVKDVRGELKELRIVLFGLNGDNGLNSEVKSLRVSRHSADTLLTTHAFRLDELEHKLTAR